MKEKVIKLMLELEEALREDDRGYTAVCVVGTPPGHLNQATFERLKVGTLFPQQAGCRAWMPADLADVIGFLARDWRDF